MDAQTSHIGLRIDYEHESKPLLFASTHAEEIKSYVVLEFQVKEYANIRRSIKGQAWQYAVRGARYSNCILLEYDAEHKQT